MVANNNCWWCSSRVGKTTELESYTPCSKCVEAMKRGILMMSYRAKGTEMCALDGGVDYSKIYRTGSSFVCDPEYFKQLLSDSPEDQEDLRTILEQRYQFLADKFWDDIGFPRRDNPSGHWCVDGVCACESDKTDYQYANTKGKFVPMKCATTWGEFKRMKASVLKHYPDAHVYWVMGPCAKEGARNDD